MDIIIFLGLLICFLLIAILFALTISLNANLKTLQKRINQLQEERHNISASQVLNTTERSPVQETRSTAESTEEKTAAVPAKTSIEEAPQIGVLQEPPAIETRIPIQAEPQPASVEEPAIEKPLPDNLTPAEEKILPKTEETEHIDSPLDWVSSFFTSGNIIAKIGITILFFGIAFLAKYAADNGMVPIEFRLSGIGIAGIVMLAFGWRLRIKRAGYALILQGGALAVLYLTIFSALRLYELLPSTVAFGLLFVIAVVSATLAVLQHSLALAIFATCGGFMAPILTSTGSGKYAELFIYYLVLNLAIFAIGWFKSWRVLNVLGFLFTFSVATIWGISSYTDADFATTETFLIIFYLLYVTISVLYSIKQPVKLKGYVDSTLVFGVPIVGFGLQAGVVHDFEYGLAWSSGILSIFYLTLAAVLWRKLTEEFRLICEAFIALGIIFATLTIPFAFDATWTSATWALEGAAAVWLGRRQNRFLSRFFGYLLQGGAVIAFFISLIDAPPDPIPLMNHIYLGAVLIALSSGFVSWQIEQLISATEEAEEKPKLGLGLSLEKLLIVPFLGWGLLWWFCIGLYEVERYLDAEYRPLSLLLFTGVSMTTIQLIKRHTGWSKLFYPALSLLPFLYLLLPAAIYRNEHPFGGLNILGWGASLTAYFWILKQYDEQKSTITNLIHVGGFWFIVILFTIEGAYQVDDIIQGAENWPLNTIGLIPALFILLMLLAGDKISWPVKKHERQYQGVALYPMILAVWGYFVLLNIFSSGNAAPLPYYPILNPLDIVLAVQLFSIIYWLRKPLAFESWHQRNPPKKWRLESAKLFLALSFFLWLNAMWLRLAHHMWEIDFDFSDMLASNSVQTGISILWSITGLSCMVMGTRRAMRDIWIMGVIAMGAVVLKLFTFDLANTGTVERIVSFIFVGILLLTVGYFAPVPPTKEALSLEKEDEKEKKEGSDGSEKLDDELENKDKTAQETTEANDD